MTTECDSTAPAASGPTGGFRAVLHAVAWGPAIGGVMVGVVLGSGYSFFNRLASVPPVELAASVDERPVVGTPAHIVVPATAAKSTETRELRDVTLRPLPSAPVQQTIATLSAPTSRVEAEVRSLKGASASYANDLEERGNRTSGRADAVAAVWGFLAVGLGGSTASAPSTPRNNNIRQPR